MIRRLQVENHGGRFSLSSHKPRMYIDEELALILCGAKKDIPGPGKGLVIEYYWVQEMAVEEL